MLLSPLNTEDEEEEEEEEEGGTSPAQEDDECDESSAPSRGSSVAERSHSEEEDAAMAGDDGDDTDDDNDGVESDQQSDEDDGADHHLGGTSDNGDDKSQEEEVLAAADEGHSSSSENDSEQADSVVDDDDATIEDPDEPLTKSSSSEGEEDEEEGEEAATAKLGGSNGTPAYALLVGMRDPEPAGSGDPREIISVPITRLPITLGREHATKDSSFVGLKDDDGASAGAVSEGVPRLSQSMCSIFYRDARGGRLGLYKRGRKKESDPADDKEDDDPLEGMVYKPCDNSSLAGGVDCNESKGGSAAAPAQRPEDSVLRPPGMDANTPLPASGFFAIECTGGQIVVGGRVIRKGRVAMLNDGMPIRIASHCFYFLLPKKSSLPPPTFVKVRSAATTAPAAINVEKAVSPKPAVVRKEGDGGAGARGKKDEAAPPPPPLRPPTKKPRRSEDPPPPGALFDDRSDAELLALLASKVDRATWDHEGQKVGSALATRACRAAAAAPAVRAIVRAEGGVTQREIVDWMTNGPDSIYRTYEAMMLTKIVEKSFMMSMGKAVLRAGYSKNEYLSGRAFRWNLPEDVGASQPEGGGNGEEGGGSSPSSPAPRREDVEERSSRALENCANEEEEDDDDDEMDTNNEQAEQDGEGNESMELSDIKSEEIPMEPDETISTDI